MPRKRTCEQFIKSLLRKKENGNLSKEEGCMIGKYIRLGRPKDWDWTVLRYEYSK